MKRCHRRAGIIAPGYRVARGKCAKDSQKLNIVFIAQQRADIDQLSIADLTERSRNLFLLRCSEEASALGQIAELNSGGEMPIDSTRHEAAPPRNFID